MRDQISLRTSIANKKVIKYVILDIDYQKRSMRKLRERSYTMAWILRNKSITLREKVSKNITSYLYFKGITTSYENHHLP